jgi:hypothetical protein
MSRDTVRETQAQGSDRGPWIQTFTGRAFHYEDPQPEDVHIEDIAQALSKQCRFAGHTTRFYSVAEHSVLLARYVSQPVKLWALLHDASEAYLVDVPRPVKPYLEGYDRFERVVMYRIRERFDLFGLNNQFDVAWAGHMPAEVKAADIRICVDEKAQNMAPGPMWGIDGLDPLGVTLQFWSPEQAEAEFLSTFTELMAAWRAGRGEASA